MSSSGGWASFKWRCRSTSSSGGERASSDGGCRSTSSSGGERVSGGGSDISSGWANLWQRQYVSKGAISLLARSPELESIKDVDPCEDLTDEDIRTAIQNATQRSCLITTFHPYRRPL
nr:dynamin-related protein 3A-like [Ipomoea batatas]